MEQMRLRGGWSMASSENSRGKGAMVLSPETQAEFQRLVEGHRRLLEAIGKL